jgi:hypothetical protein
MDTTTINKNADFSAWELETIFHMASNSAAISSSPFFEKYQALANKAINQRSEKFPEYNKPNTNGWLKEWGGYEN